MKFILSMLMASLFFIGCSNDKPVQNVEAKLQVGKSLEGMQLPDQHKKVQTLPQNTKVVFFSFSKPVGHMCNEFLANHPADYLPKHNAVYVADVSPAPSLIKKMFILPDLEKLPFPILLIDDDTVSAAYTKGMDKEHIVVVILKDQKIQAIKKAANAKELQKFIEQ